MRTALILGASSDLGKEIAKNLHKEGFEVIGTKRTNHKISDTNVTKFIDFDIKKDADQENLIKELKNKKISFLTNTISTKPELNRFEKIDTKIFEEDFKVNVLQYIKFLKRIIPKMEKDSNIVFILSEIVCSDRLKYVSSYQISKYALLGLMDALGEELQKKNVRVNAVSPGMMNTKFIEQIPKFVKENYKHKYGFILPKQVSKQIINIINNSDINLQNIEVTNK